jgi:probable HAF family extracellular repeat protein
MSLKSGVWIALVAGVLLASVGRVSAGGRYTITDLGTLGGTMAGANAINDAGQITGWSLKNVGADVHAHAFRWTPGGTDGPASNPQMTDLGTLGLAPHSYGNAINASGQVAGNNSDEQGFRCSGNGPMEDLLSLGPGGTNGSHANGINDSGQITGVSGTGPPNNHNHAYTAGGAGMSDLGTFGGSESAGFGINAGGQVAGYAYLSDNTTAHAFRSLQDLGTLGGNRSEAYAINDSGQVTGYARTSDGAEHAFLWTSSGSDGPPNNPRMKDLGPLGATYPRTYGLGINNSGQVVGKAYSSGYCAFLYSAGVMTDLNSLIDSASGWSLTEATDINNNGQIVGNGFHNGQQHAFLLTPRVPATLRGLEVNQVIQDWSNSVPLIEGKRTWVRAFVKAVKPADGGKKATGQLHGYRGGIQFSDSPLRPINVASAGKLFADETSDDMRKDDLFSLNFELPRTWIEGAVQLQFEGLNVDVECGEPAELGGTANDCIVTASFQRHPFPKIIFFRVGVRAPSDGLFYQPSEVEVDKMVTELSDYLPFDSLEYTVSHIEPGGDNVFQANGDLDGENLFEALLDAASADVSVEPVLYYCLFKGPFSPSLHNGFRFSGIARDIVGFVGMGFLERVTTAHEVGHLIGRDHSVDHALGADQDGYWRGYCGELADPDAPSFPYFYTNPRLPQPTFPALGPMTQGTDALIYGIGPSRGPDFFLNISSPFDASDLMGYCGSSKPSKWTYEGLIAQLDLSWFALASGATPPRKPQPAPLEALVPGCNSGPFNYLLVRGFVNLETNEVAWLPFRCLNLSEAPAIPQPGPYVLETLNASGGVLTNVSFGLIPSEHATTRVSRMRFTLPLDASVRQVRLRKDADVLGVRVASANVPTVQVLSPNGGEVLSNDTVTITWAGTDVDGDTLAFNVAYSHNGGTNWSPLAVDIRTNVLTILRSSLEASTNGVVRVSVSDGFWFASDCSDEPFTVANNGPRISIVSPNDGRRYSAGQLILLSALAADPEEGSRGMTNVTWWTGAVGTLGNGRDLSLAAGTLPLGTNIITAIATDSSGASATGAVAVIIVSPPIITVQPTNQAYNAGTTATFAVTVAGTEPFGYQWTKSATNLADGGTVSDAATASLSLSNVSAADAAFYRVVITNLYGGVTSAPAILTVYLPPSITTQPQSQTVDAGANAGFTIRVGGAQPLSYQWRFNGTNLPGATLSSFTRTSAQLADVGGYSVEVTNVAGSVTSAVATLTLTPQGPDSIVNRFDSAGEIGGWRFDYGGVTHAETFDPAVDGNDDPASGSMKVTMNFDTALGGNNNAAYTRDAFFPAVNGSNFAQLQFDVKVDPASAVDAFGNNGNFSLALRNTDSYNYIGQDNRNLRSADGWVHISVPLTPPYDQIRAITWQIYGGPSGNLPGPVTLWFDNVKFTGGPLRITTQPQSRTNAAGTTATFSVAASSNEPLSYQWRKNGLDLANGGTISGATSATLTLSGVLPADAGSYTVLVQNAVLSDAATLTVNPLILYEPFDYTNVGGPVSSNTAANWAYGGSGANDLSVVSGNLSYPGLASSAGNSVTNGGAGLGVRRLLGGSFSSGALYFSALFRINDLGYGAWNGNATQVGSLQAPDNSSVRFSIQVKSNSPSTYVVGVQKGGTGATTVLATNEYLAGETLFLVGRYDFSVSPNAVALWVDPAVPTFGAVSEPGSNFLSATTGTDGLAIDRFNLRQNAATGSFSVPASMQWDELRFGLTWASVTPPGAAASNQPPVLAAIANRTVHAGSAVTFTNSATDPDTNTLTFSLDAGAPPEATIGPTNGVFNWPTADANIGGTSNITVRVTDDGSPPRSDARTFSVSVAPRLALQSILISNDTNAIFTWNSIPGTTYRAQYKTNLSQAGWIDLVPTITAAGSTASRTETIVPAAERYYRISLVGY